MRKNILQHIGAIVSGKRNEEHLTQQQLAQQTGRGLRHIQNIEKGRGNASIEVLADVIYRLGLSADVLFYLICRNWNSRRSSYCASSQPARKMKGRFC